MQKRGQASIEYLILIGTILIITIPIFSYALYQSSERNRLNQADDAVNTLAKTADTVYSLGSGTKNYVWITIPAGIVSTSVSGNEILLKLGIYSGISDIYAKTKSTLTGSVPSDKGTYKMLVEALDSGIVLIGSISNITTTTTTTISGGTTTTTTILGGCGDGVCSWLPGDNCNDCPGDCPIPNGYSCCPLDANQEYWFFFQGETCPEVPPTTSNCADYCVFVGYTNGVCRQSQGQCNVNNEIWESEGDTYCIGGPTGDFCCCMP